MPQLNAMRIGYVLKMYPRFSETFILNEILAHEAAGTSIDIFSLRPPRDGRFHEALARVRAPVHYLRLPTEGIGALADRIATPSHVDVFWTALNDAAAVLPDLWARLERAEGEKARDVFQAINLARMVRERGITHLHAHFGSLATTVARLAAHFADVPYSFTAHAKDLFHESVQPPDLRRKLEDAASVITVSDFNVAFLRENYGPAAERVSRIYNGIDLQQFGYASPVSRPPLIVGVGRLIEKKGFGDLIAACALLRDQDRTFKCQIIGSGPLEQALRDQIARLELTNCVELLGPRPQGEVRDLVQRAAVFAAPCVIGEDGNRDGLPTVLLEAMALGTPCVSTDVTGIPEVLHHNETGLMVPQHDPAALANAIARLLDNAAQRGALAEHARRLIEDEFDIVHNTARIREVFAQAQSRDVLMEVA
jgi:colanic acid/amylovoran biosynthesis glycosyltransferase